MRSHGRAPKRSRPTKEPEDDVYVHARDEDVIVTSSYSRANSSHRSENYRTPSSSNRSMYDSTRDIHSSRTRYEDNDWRGREDPVASGRYDDSYRQDERDVYTAPLTREPEPWHSSNEVSRSHTRTDYPPRFGSSTTTAEYNEASAWSSTATTSYDNARRPYYADWRQRGERDSAVDDRDPSTERSYSKGDRSRWSRSHQPEKRFQSDSGWESRRQDRVWEQRNKIEEQVFDKADPPVEDRSWEPAASWKSSNRNFQERRSQDTQRVSHGYYKQRTKKRGQEGFKPRRDWREDDSLNNWTRREPPPVKKPAHYKSTRSVSSQSRSPSPARSYRSRRSSRGRSRSRSPSPVHKRRKQNISPDTTQSQFPGDNDIQGWIPRKRERQPSRSASPYNDSNGVRGRRRSASVSSASSGRSISGSPVPVHRLPSKASSVSTSPSNSTRTSGFIKNPNYRNGKQRKQHANGRQHYDSGHRKAGTWEQPLLDSTPMPPPSIIPKNRKPRYPEEDISLATSPPLSRDNLSPSNRNVGFKPIGVSMASGKTTGKPNSELRRFFPAEDEELEYIEEHSARLTDQDLPSDSRGPPHDPMPRSWDRSDEYSMSVDREDRGWKPRYEMVQTSQQSGLQEQLPSYLHSSRDTNVERLNPDSVRPERIPNRHISNQWPLSYERPLLGAPEHTDLEIQSVTPVASSTIAPSSNVSHSVGNVGSTLEGPLSTQLSDRQESPSVAPEVPTPSSSSKELYSIVSQVGEGTFGKVYKARNTISNLHVALKRIRMEAEKDGFPVTAMREIKLLQSLRHANIVQLYEMMVSNGSVYMVFEYMDHDLTGVLSQTQLSFSDAHLKSLCHQMLAGLKYLHHKGVIHRDIKGSNILVNNRGELKLADFGLARFYQKRRRSDYTNRVITLWYRPPELLLGATEYGPEVDMWSAGCIMLELFTKKPVFQGADEINQLEVVYKILGTPTPERWPSVVNLPWYELVKPSEIIPNHFRELFRKWMSPAALDLAEQLLSYDPAQRISAAEAMETPYFTQESPVADRPIGLASLEGEWHEFETKRERERRKHQQHQRRKLEAAG